MMRTWLGAALAAGLLVLPAAGMAKDGVRLTPDKAAKLRNAGAEVLFWSQAERDANFPNMERLFPGDTVAASDHPRPLPDGKPLALGPGDPAGAYMVANNVAGLLVLQHGKVRLERYARGFSRTGRWTSFSVAKSLTSTLVGAAIADGYIASVDDPVSRYIPELTGAGYDGVTIRQVLTMTSGVRWNEDYTDPKSDVARMLTEPPPAGVDQTVAYMRALPREAEPGTKWVYKTGETNLIGVLVARATGKSLAAYAAEKIWQPYGMEQPLFWMVDSGGGNIGGCCLSASLRDYARIGQFVLDGGVAAGRKVVADGWFAAATHGQADTGAPGYGYGYQWWTEPDASFDARGIFGQMIHIDPARGLVVAMVSAWPRATDPALSEARRVFVTRISAALDAGR